MLELFPSLATSSRTLLEDLRSNAPGAAGAAFEVLKAEVGGPVEAQVMATVGRTIVGAAVRSQLTEDAVSETWCAVLQHRKRFKGQDIESFRRWVCGIARNKANQAVRETFGRRECSFEILTEQAHIGSLIDAIDENVALKAALTDALDRAALTQKQRIHAILVLEAYYAGCTTAVDAYAEAAESEAGAGWMRVKEVWLEVRKQIRLDPGIVCASY